MERTSRIDACECFSYYFIWLCLKPWTRDRQPKLQMIKLVLKEASGPAPADSLHSKWYCHLWDHNSWGMKESVSINLLPGRSYFSATELHKHFFFFFTVTLGKLRFLPSFCQKFPSQVRTTGPPWTIWIIKICFCFYDLAAATWKAKWECFL